MAQAKSEPHHENLSSVFQTRSDTNQAVQPQKMARGLEFDLGSKGLLLYVSKTKALISCSFAMQLICAFAFAYAKSRQVLGPHWIASSFLEHILDHI